MQQLSALDSWFLHLENPRMPMHIGAINIFVPTDEEQAFNFDVFKTYIGDRLHLSPVFRRRLVEVPMNMGRPFWVGRSRLQPRCAFVSCRPAAPWFATGAKQISGAAV